MGRRFTRSATGAPAGPVAQDLHWARERRSAVDVAALLVLDAGSGRLDPTRGALWTGLAAAGALGRGACGAAG
ncbi:hypothetical protein ACIPYQ_38240 [Streptomyces sp. NPDC090045]|uniref:hypothetical protein n=1 Tax=Streptomyces sp. NPDC090045 TaxID=3365927 RepID=UPI003808100F